MPSVVFLRAVNVGRTNRCQPALIAKELARLDIVNIGAVGTFVVRKNVSESALRAAFARKLPFKAASGRKAFSASRTSPMLMYLPPTRVVVAKSLPTATI